MSAQAARLRFGLVDDWMGPSQDPLVPTYLLLDPHLVRQPGHSLPQIHLHGPALHPRICWSGPRPITGDQYRLPLRPWRSRQSWTIRRHGHRCTAHQAGSRSRRRRTRHEYPESRLRDDAQDCEIAPADLVDLAVLPVARPAHRGPVHTCYQAGGERVGRAGYAGRRRGREDFKLLERWKEFQRGEGCEQEKNPRQSLIEPKLMEAFRPFDRVRE